MPTENLSKIAIALKGLDETLSEAFHSIVRDLTNEVSRTHEYSDFDQNAIHHGRCEYIRLVNRDASVPAFEVSLEFDSEVFLITVPDTLVRLHEDITQAQRNLVNAPLADKPEYQKALNDLSEQYHTVIQAEASRIISEA